ncbi:MAG: ABC transporter substrate-binding protein [Deltaproteobacteria bacterium]|nr:ABC transporter substrate-binding protein [Deltaproteobacteria bacterium]
MNFQTISDIIDTLLALDLDRGCLVFPQYTSSADELSLPELPMKFFLAILCSLALILAGAKIASTNSPPSGQPKSLRIASWALPLGSQARIYETFCGLKAMLTFLNTKGNINGRRLEFYSQEMDDSTPNFPARLNTMIQQSQPLAVVGGAVDLRSGETADYFRRTGLVWFGPWSQSVSLYRGLDNDPVGLIPSQENQLTLLFGHAAKKLGAKAKIFVIYQQTDGYSDFDQAAAKAAAEKFGLTLDLMAISSNFRDWNTVRERTAGARVLLLWVPSGPAVALLRAVKPSLPPETIFMTHALNPPGLELWEMTGGLWDRMIFPSVLTIEPLRLQAYDAVLQRYGPQGLTPGYLSYLGVAQAQILARTLINAEAGNKNQAVRTAFEAENGTGSLLTTTGFVTGPPPIEAAYLAMVSRSKGWEAVD